MNENEAELLRMIHENENPEQALTIALGVVVTYLRQQGMLTEPPAAAIGAV